jgi:hypothetical protein
MYRLTFLSGNMKGRRVAVQRGTVLIGRDPECHIDLKGDDEVSRRHAQIETRPDGVYIRDLGALNRTEVNGKPVAESHLRSGDRLLIGTTLLEFREIEPVLAVSGRRTGRLQLLTFVAVVAVIGLQILFVAFFRAGTGADIEPLARPAPAVEGGVTSSPAGGDELDAELDRAVARLRESGQLTNLAAALESMEAAVPASQPAATAAAPAVAEAPAAAPTQPANPPPPVEAASPSETAANEAPASEAAPRPAGRIRIASVERDRFQQGREFDEMRLFKIVLRRTPDEGLLDASGVDVRVCFYDRAVRSGLVAPSRAAPVPEAPMRLSGDWPSGEARNVTAPYVIPKGGRLEEAAAHGDEFRYEGYRVQVWIGGELQDESAMPSSLLTLPFPAASR